MLCAPKYQGRQKETLEHPDQGTCWTGTPESTGPERLLKCRKEGRHKKGKHVSAPLKTERLNPILEQIKDQRRPEIWKKEGDHGPRTISPIHFYNYVLWGVPRVRPAVTFKNRSMVKHPARGSGGGKTHNHGTRASKKVHLTEHLTLTSYGPSNEGRCLTGGRGFSHRQTDPGETPWSVFGVNQNRVCTTSQKKHKLGRKERYNHKTTGCLEGKKEPSRTGRTGSSKAKETFLSSPFEDQTERGEDGPISGRAGVSLSTQGLKGGAVKRK